MRAWTRGEKIGAWSLLIGGVTCFAVIVASLRSGPDEAPADRTAETGHAEAYREVLDEQRRLLAEETKALRAELRSLHDERIATRRDRITNLAERFHEGEEAEYDTIALRNACTVEIAVALHYLDLDDAWITRGWWNVAPGQTVTTDAMTRNAYVYFYGENRSAGRSWNGDGTEEALTLDVVDARFDHLEGERWVYDPPVRASFFRRHTGDGWTEHVETFECLVEAKPVPAAEPAVSAPPAEAPPPEAPPA
jgi:hypothetical protein